MSSQAVRELFHQEFSTTVQSMPEDSEELLSESEADKIQKEVQNVKRSAFSATKLVEEWRLITDTPAHLFWVPAHLHPEIAPSEFKKWLEQHSTMVNRQEDHLIRRKSILSLHSYSRREREDLQDSDSSVTSQQVTALLQRRNTYNADGSHGSTDSNQTFPTQDQLNKYIIQTLEKPTLKRSVRTKLRRDSQMSTRSNRKHKYKGREYRKVHNESVTEEDPKKEVQEINVLPDPPIDITEVSSEKLVNSFPSSPETPQHETSSPIISSVHPIDSKKKENVKFDKSKKSSPWTWLWNNELLSNDSSPKTNKKSKSSESLQSTLSDSSPSPLADSPKSDTTTSDMSFVDNPLDPYNEHAPTQESKGKKTKSKKSSSGLNFFFKSKTKTSTHPEKDKSKNLSDTQSSSSNETEPKSNDLIQDSADYRLPLHIERAIYRLSHIKLANPRRPLYHQVLISNLMLWYLAIISRPGIADQASYSYDSSNEQIKSNHSSNKKSKNKSKRTDKKETAVKNGPFGPQKKQAHHQVNAYEEQRKDAAPYRSPSLYSSSFDDDEDDVPLALYKSGEIHPITSNS